jgi:hypothetical protein
MKSLYKTTLDNIIIHVKDVMRKESANGVNTFLKDVHHWSTKDLDKRLEESVIH